MRIAVLTTQVPFVRGGAELQAEWLVERLRAYGHHAELVALPLRTHSARTVLEHMLVARLTSVRAAERVIGLKFPAYHVPHEDKLLWILHQHRPAYDLWGTAFGEIPDTIEGRYARDAIVEADNRLLRDVHRVFVTSEVNARRMHSFNGVQPEVLHPPLGFPESYYCERPGDYLFYPSRIASTKRQRLALEAMLHTSSRVRLVIAGAADDHGELHALERIAADPRLRGRIKLLPWWVPEEEKLKLLAGCLGVLFPPYDEDFGYVTLESFLSSKPVITCADSGGPLELVEHRVSGLVADPDPESLGRAIDELARDRDRAIRMGAAGRERISELQISWDHVVQELTA